MATSPATSTPFKQAVTGVAPPSLAEGRIREVFPAMPGITPLAGLIKKLVQSLIFTPVGIALTAPFFALKFAPVVCKRYTLTNKRLMIRRGWKPACAQEIALSDIKDVRLVGEVDPFYVSGTLEIINRSDAVAMTLLGVPEPEGFRQAILNAVSAWTWKPGVEPSQAFVPATFKPK